MQIALTSSGEWGREVDHTGEDYVKSDALYPAYCLASAGTLTAEPTFVYLNQDAVDGVASEGVEDSYYVGTDGKVYQIVENGTDTVVAPSNANPFILDGQEETVEDEQQVVWHTVQTDSDWLKLDTTNANMKATVQPKVSFARTQIKAIDSAMVFGFYNCTEMTWEMSKPWANNNTNSASVTLANITVTPTASEYKFFMWYDGEDDACKNANAVTNILTATITYTATSIVDTSSGN